MLPKLQIHEGLLMTTSVIFVLNAEKKKQSENLWYKAQNTTQYYLTYVERRKGGEFKDEWYWNGYLITKKIDLVFKPAEIICSTYEASH